MCMPHSTKTFKSQRREKKVKPKASAPFNKKLLEPDVDFKDERTHTYIPKAKNKSLLDEFFSIFK